MSHKVRVADVAEDDLIAIVEYIFDQEGELAPGLAVQTRIEKAIATLADKPTRGRVVPALRRLGISQFRELIEHPWRIIYRVHVREVRVVAIIDGRRSADDLIRERALRSIQDQ